MGLLELYFIIIVVYHCLRKTEKCMEKKYIYNWLYYCKVGKRSVRCIVKNIGSGLCVIILLNKTAVWVMVLEKM